MDDKSELIACIETGNFARAARIAAGNWAAFTLPLERTCALLVSIYLLSILFMIAYIKQHNIGSSTLTKRFDKRI